MSGTRNRSIRWVWIVLALCSATLAARALADEPLYLKHMAQHYPYPGRVDPYLCDYNRDGYQDLLVNYRNETWIADSFTGDILRTYYATDWLSEWWPVPSESLPDMDGDGLRDLLITDPMTYPSSGGRGTTQRIGSAAPGDVVATMQATYRVDNVLGDEIMSFCSAANDRTVAVAIDGSEKVALLNAATGQIVARLQADRSSADSMQNIGDVNGNGTDDFAFGFGNSYMGPSGSSGRVFIVDGSTTTTAWTDFDALPGDHLIAILSAGAEVLLGGHAGQGERHLYANLGDPTPDDGMRDVLMVTGTPGAIGGTYRGGFAVQLVSFDDTGDVTVRQIDVELGVNRDQFLGRDVAALPDVNGDSVADVAILDPGNRQVLVISGAGLLDGFDNADVLQYLHGPSGFYIGQDYLRPMGDWDGDGRQEILLQLVSSDRKQYPWAIYGVIPEPATLALLVMGGLAAFRRRRGRERRP